MATHSCLSARNNWRTFAGAYTLPRRCLSNSFRVCLFGFKSGDMEGQWRIWTWLLARNRVVSRGSGIVLLKCSTTQRLMPEMKQQKKKKNYTFLLLNRIHVNPSKWYVPKPQPHLHPHPSVSKFPPKKKSRRRPMVRSFSDRHCDWKSTQSRGWYFCRPEETVKETPTKDACALEQPGMSSHSSQPSPSFSASYNNPAYAPWAWINKYVLLFFFLRKREKVYFPTDRTTRGFVVDVDVDDDDILRQFVLTWHNSCFLSPNPARL